MNSGKVIVGILTSLAAGAAIGLLFAPETGARTREKIYKKGEDITGDLENKFHAFIEGVKDKYESISHQAEHVAKIGADKSEKFLKEVSTNGNLS